MDGACACATPEMPHYVVQVIDRQGNRRSLREVAPDEAALRENLRARALWVVAVRSDRGVRGNARLRLPVRDFIAVLHQFELQVRAGVTADAALARLAEDAPRGRARTMLGTIRDLVAEGRPIHEACRQFPRQFPPHVAAVIAAGEASAQLPEALRALATHLTETDELVRTARRALIYPVIVLAVTGGMVVFLLGGVVPKFAEIFGAMRLTLPAPTVFLIRLGELLRGHGGTLVLATGMLVILAGASLRSRRLRRWRDAGLLRLPGWGEAVRCLATARFAAHVRLLHDAGVPVLDALASGAEVTGNAVLESQLLAARERVAAGRTLAAALPAGNAFPRFFAPALRAGESTGQFGAALRHIEEYAASRARETLATALALLEPALLAGLTAVVGFIVLSFFLPLFSLLGGINAR